MALFDIQSLLKDLQALGGSENPFDFIAAKIEGATDQGWTTAHTIVVATCGTIWCASLAVNVATVVRRWRSGELCFVRRQASRLGIFYIPHITSLWAAIQIPVGLAFLLSIVVMLYEAYGRPLRYSFALRNLVYIGCIVLGWTQVVNTLSSGLVAYAAHSSRSQYPSQSTNLAPFVNAFALLVPILTMVADVTLQSLATVHLAHVLDGLDGMVQILRDLSPTWQPGSGLPLQQLLALQPLGEPLPRQIDLFQRYTRWWAIAMVIYLVLAICVVVPAGAYQIRDIYQQRQQLRSVRVRQISSVYTPAELKQTPFQRFKAALLVRYSNQQLYSNQGSSITVEGTHLLLLEDVCKNVILATSFFLCSTACLIPLSAYGIWRLSKGGTGGNFSLLATLQVVALAELTAFFFTIDVILFLRSRLSGNLPVTSTRSSTRQAMVRIPVHQLSFEEDRELQAMDDKL